MNLAEIKNIIANGESETVELKKSTSKLQSAAETLCAYLNGRGGVVLIGVTDDKRLIGQDVSDKTQQEIANVLRKIEPTANVEVNICDCGNADKKIIVIKAYPDKHSIPYIFNGRPYERKGTATNRMPQARYQQLLLERTNHSHSWDDQVATGVTLEDLDQDEIVRTVRLGVNKNRIDPITDATNAVEVLKKLKLMSNNQITNAAVVLFCKEIPPQYLQCLIRMARFRGKTKGDFIDSRREHGNMFYLLNEAEAFIKRHTSISSRFEDYKFERIDEPEYPPSALREALINAFCHRSYNHVGGSISLIIYDDRVEVTSPGQLPNGVTIEELKTSHESTPRNESIANVLYRRGVIETFGYGTEEMIKSSRELGAPDPDFIEGENSFIVRFWSKNAKEDQVIVDLSKRQQEIMYLFSQHEVLSVREILAKLANPPSPRTLRHDLAQLKELGFIESQGKARALVWSMIKSKSHN